MLWRKRVRLTLKNASTCSVPIRTRASHLHAFVANAQLVFNVFFFFPFIYYLSINSHRSFIDARALIRQCFCIITRRVSYNPTYCVAAAVQCFSTARWPAAKLVCTIIEKVRKNLYFTSYTWYTGFSCIINRDIVVFFF